MSGNNIKVVCRFRPQNSLEIREGGVPIISIDDEGTNVQLKVSWQYFSSSYVMNHATVTYTIKYFLLG